MRAVNLLYTVCHNYRNP